MTERNVKVLPDAGPRQMIDSALGTLREVRYTPDDQDSPDSPQIVSTEAEHLLTSSHIPDPKRVRRTDILASRIESDEIGYRKDYGEGRS